MSFKGIRNTNGRPKGSLNKLNSEVKAYGLGREY
tara:strand:+ start:1575 stop:1676 length:102 start_codon:yes stop_codon:yes gene_type:complete